MGWSGGTNLMVSVISAVKSRVESEEDRAAIYRPIIRAFIDEDWDTTDECEGYDEAFDAAMTAVLRSKRRR